MLAAGHKTLNIKMNSWKGFFFLVVVFFILSNLGCLHESHPPVVIYKVLST